MAAHEVAQFVLEPFREKMAERVERGFAMSPFQLARELGLGRTTVHAAIASGKLPAFRIGKLYRIKPERIPLDLLRWWTRPRPEDVWPSGALVYFVQGVPGYVKIGFSTKLSSRVRDLQVGCPVAIKLLAHVHGDVGLERDYHRRFSEHRLEGEWFRLAPEIEAEIERLTT